MFKCVPDKAATLDIYYADKCAVFILPEPLAGIVASARYPAFKPTFVKSPEVMPLLKSLHSLIIGHA